MRRLLFLPLLLAAPALAAPDWSSYDNARYSYRGAVPPGFSGYGESDNGDGQIFDHQPTRQVLSYWGSMVPEDDFTAEVATAMANAEEQGWNIAYQAVTPDWATFTGIMGQQQFQTRMILLCDRISTASMTLQYTSAQAADIKPVLQELEAGLVATGC